MLCGRAIFNSFRLRCGSFLSRADDGTSDVIMASDADLALQDELLDACSSSYPNIDRVDRVVRMAVGLGIRWAGLRHS